MSMQIETDKRHRMIAEAAYFRAERRGFDGGDPVGDWIEAEVEIDAELQRRQHGELLARLEERVAEAGKKVEALRKKAKSAERNARAELQQELDRIAPLRDALEKRRDEIREQGLQVSRKLVEQAEQLWQELSEFLGRKKGRRRSSKGK